MGFEPTTFSLLYMRPRYQLRHESYLTVCIYRWIISIWLSIHIEPHGLVKSDWLIVFCNVHVKQYMYLHLLLSTIVDYMYVSSLTQFNTNTTPHKKKIFKKKYPTRIYNTDEKKKALNVHWIGLGCFQHGHLSSFQWCALGDASLVWNETNSKLNFQLQNIKMLTAIIIIIVR